MPRVSVLQIFTFLLLISACVYVANHVARYLLKEDGGYSQWSEFSECSKTCGGGIRLRRRVCSHPYPRFGGRNCSSLGKPIQVFKCNRNPCPVNGGYGNWLSFGPCSTTCGEGIRKRQRQCDRPMPQYGGKNCKEMELGEDTQTEKCNMRKCPVNGGYSEWSKFSDCSVSCGGGNMTRSRKCTNPMPDHGGKDCKELGPSEETHACNTQTCSTTRPPTTLPPTTKTSPATTTNSNKISKSQTPTKKQQKSTEKRLNSSEEETASSQIKPKNTKISPSVSREKTPKYSKIYHPKSTFIPLRSSETIQNSTALLMSS